MSSTLSRIPRQQDGSQPSSVFVIQTHFLMRYMIVSVSFPYASLNTCTSGGLPYTRASWL